MDLMEPKIVLSKLMLSCKTVLIRTNWSNHQSTSENRFDHDLISRNASITSQVRLSRY